MSKRNRLPSLLFLAGLFLSCPSRSGCEETVWRIGIGDNDYQEFALAGKFKEYRPLFPDDVSFTVGVSDTRRDWPHIHPGPLDRWAGNRVHPFHIWFDLSEPVRTGALLTLDLLGAHAAKPPILEVCINGHKAALATVPGPGDGPLNDPSLGVEQIGELYFNGDLLREGRNLITFTTSSGSWLIYDAVTLTVGVALPETGLAEFTPGCDEGIGYPMWSIGSRDNSFEEFALSGNYAAYARQITQPVVYDVAHSKPEEHWPYCHPGPIDRWAGGKEHPYRVTFDLQDSDLLDSRLTVDLTNTQPFNPSVLAIELNGHSARYFLPLGAGFASLTDPKAGKEHVIVLELGKEMLVRGRNSLTLTLSQGSWMVYDAITLEGLITPSRLPAIREFSAVPTALFSGEGASLRRMVETRVENWGMEKSGRLQLTIGRDETSVELPVLPLGQIRHRLPIKDYAEAVKGIVTLSAGGETLTQELTIEPQRKWLLFVAPHVHTDLGYTASQPVVRELHARNLDRIVQASGQDEGLRWSCETAWQVENYLERRKPEQAARLLDLMRKGRIGVHAQYMNLLTGLCGHEQLNRLCYFAAALKGVHRVPIKVASITDVPTCVGALPMVLSNSGIDCFAQGINGFRAPFYDKSEIKSPFFWEGPDGSKVLSWFTPGYAQMSQIGLDYNYDQVERKIETFLNYYERPDYPYDAVYLFGAFGDNKSISTGFSAVAAQWNAKWTFPRIVLSNDDGFFEYVRKHFADRIPTIRGDAGAYWEDGAASSAYETAVNRKTHDALPSAEKLFSFLSLAGSSLPYPDAAFHRSWKDVMWYDEHTWGSVLSVSDPDHPVVKEQWDNKIMPVHRASRDVQELVGNAMASLGHLIRTRTRSVVVFNPLSWDRTDLVRIALPADIYPPAVVMADPSTGASLPAQLISEQEGKRVYAFVAPDVPALGYKRFEPVPVTTLPVQISSFQDLTLENRFYAVRFDPETGAVESIVDKRDRRELLDDTSPYGANAYVYVTGLSGSGTVHTVTSAEIEEIPASCVPWGREGDLRSCRPVVERVIVRSFAMNTPALEREILLYESLPRIDFINRVVKDETREKEAVYFAFPFRASSPVFHYEGPNSIVNPARDMLRGACLDWFAIQHWVHVADPGGGVTLAAPDSPLVCLGDLTAGKKLTEFSPATGGIYPYVMNNYWTTNYRAGQGGSFEFRYSVSSHGGTLDRVASTRFGWEAANPLEAVLAAANPEGHLDPSSGSFLRVGARNVLVLAVKKAEDGDGWIIRLWEVEGRDTLVDLVFPIWVPSAAVSTNLVEDNLRVLQVDGNRLQVPVKARGVVTLRVK